MSATVITMDLSGEWTLKSSFGETSVAVPGDYYSDLFNWGKIADPYWGNGAAAVEKLPLDPVYIRWFSYTPLPETRQAVLRFEGIDTLSAVFLNGHPLGRTDNMHRTWEFSVLPFLQEGRNCLEVRFSSPVDWALEHHRRRPLRGADDSILGFQSLRKAHYMMGWDFVAPFPNVGIFRPVSLCLMDSARLTAFRVEQETSRRQAVVRVGLKAENLTGKKLTACVYLTDPSGLVTERTLPLSDQAEAVFRVAHPQLWWPNELGEQPLYTVTAVLMDGDREEDRQEKRIGLRQLRLCTDKDAYGRSFTVEVNGVKIFAKGADYIPEDVLLSRRSPARTARLLESCRLAHFNMLRVWGGGFYPDDWFFDRCDEMGILVWQDFMFACCFLDDDPALLDTIDKEVDQVLERIGHHACLALLCGNNEIEEAIADWDDWMADERTKETYLTLFEDKIPAAVKAHLPAVEYIPSSPTSGGGFQEPGCVDKMDSHSWQVWHKNAPYESYRSQYYRFCSEMGFESFPSLKTLLPRLEEPDDLNVYSYEMEYRQRCRSGNRLIMQNLGLHYRMPSDFRQLVYLSQLMQADAMRYAAEHMRRHRGRCMGCLYWQLEDCWPGISWAGIDYDGRWKLLHYAAREFYAPRSLILSNFDGRVVFSVANERREPFAGTVRWRLVGADLTVLQSGRIPFAVKELSGTDIGEEDFTGLTFRQRRECVLAAELLDEDGRQLGQRTVLFVPSKHFRYKKPHLHMELEETDGRTALLIRAEEFVQNVWLEWEDTDCFFEQNGFSITGPEPVRIPMRFDGEKKTDLKELTVLSVNDL